MGSWIGLSFAGDASFIPDVFGPDPLHPNPLHTYTLPLNWGGLPQNPFRGGSKHGIRDGNYAPSELAFATITPRLLAVRLGSSVLPSRYTAGEGHNTLLRLDPFDAVPHGGARFIEKRSVVFAVHVSFAG